MTGEQFRLVFPQPLPPLESLFFGPEGDSALKVLRLWQDWPKPVVALTGPRRSGISTVLQSWAGEVGGRFLKADEWMSLDARGLADLVDQPLALDDVEQVVPSSALLTLMNLAAEQNTAMLIGGHGNPQFWHKAPPDLVSRLSAATSVTLPALDDGSFPKRLRAACLRRFIDLPEDTLAYVHPRLERSYEGIEAFANELDRTMEEKKRPASIPLARDVLASLTERPDYSEQDY